MVPSSNHLSSHKVDCWLDVGFFVLSHGRDYPYLSYSKEYSPSYLSSLSRYDIFCTACDVIGGVGIMATNFSSQKVDLVIDRYDSRSWTYQRHHIVSLMASSFIRYYLYNNTDNYSFVVTCVDGKLGVGPRTTHLSSHKYYCCLGCGGFYRLEVGIIYTRLPPTKTGTLIRYL